MYLCVYVNIYLYIHIYIYILKHTAQVRAYSAIYDQAVDATRWDPSGGGLRGDARWLEAVAHMRKVRVRPPVGELNDHGKASNEHLLLSRHPSQSNQP